jgi:hypothetical protein
MLLNEVLDELYGVYDPPEKKTEESVGEGAGAAPSTTANAVPGAVSAEPSIAALAGGPGSASSGAAAGVASASTGGGAVEGDGSAAKRVRTDTAVGESESVGAGASIDGDAGGGDGSTGGGGSGGGRSGGSLQDELAALRDKKVCCCSLLYSTLYSSAVQSSPVCSCVDACTDSVVPHYYATVTACIPSPHRPAASPPLSRRGFRA